MSTVQRSTTPARNIADCLVDAGIVDAGNIAAAVSIIAPLLPKATTYSFTADAEFLHSSITHHVKAHFDEILVPLATSHHQSTGVSGRLIKDSEVSEMAIELTTRIIVELGKQYILQLYKYMGDDTGFSNYVFSRVHSALIEASSAFNKDFLTRMSQTKRVRRATTAIEEKT